MEKSETHWVLVKRSENFRVNGEYVMFYNECSISLMLKIRYMVEVNSEVAKVSMKDEHWRKVDQIGYGEVDGEEDGCAQIPDLGEESLASTCCSEPRWYVQGQLSRPSSKICQWYISIQPSPVLRTPRSVKFRSGVPSL